MSAGWVRRALVLACLALGRAAGGAAEESAALAAWLSSQTNLTTWTAEFTQTRTLKTLTQPLVTRGRVWFAAPNRFRWELGEPAQTIAVRQPEELLVVYPRLKRAERYPLAGSGRGPMREMMLLFEAGFPRSRGELEAQFRVLGQAVAGEVHELTLEPRSAAARRLMPGLKLAFGAGEMGLRATELRFPDGSTLRNDFTNAVRNPVLATNLFALPLGAEFTVTQPGGR